ncbi:Transposon Tf2-1 polyprotein [Ceratobasidium theobromae]|uniref:Transposon Tf2-1 polyprotein n=1 Tax=Ceratobasidium theobromae TaxID=1582974 RepID=A0A5N5Q8Q0_9AGAM|nr:Transposon Tf2-1 polyprotein [Ceratobasidium theobromae]
MAGVEDEVWQALDNYEEACDEAYQEEEELLDQEISESSSKEQDFPEPLQSLAASTTSNLAQTGTQETQTILEGIIPIELGLMEIPVVQSNLTMSASPLASIPKLPSRKLLAKQLKLTSNLTKTIQLGEELVLKRLMSRPPGTAFFGSKATIIQGWIQSTKGLKQDITFDSGSEITLINKKLLKDLKPQPHVKTGQHLKLIQVTRTSFLKYFVIVLLIFETQQGPVQMVVEAYVVPRMNTPFILGTDFATQYQLSLKRDQDGTKIVFGETGRSIPVVESETMPRTNLDSHSFQVEVAQGFVNNLDKILEAQRKCQLKHKDKPIISQGVKVKIYQTVTIDPQSIKMIKVKTKFEEGQSEGFLDRTFNSHRKEKDIFAISDCLIERNNPKIQVTNLSDKPVRLQGGEIIGYMHNPRNYLAKENFHKYTKLVKAIAQQKAEEKPEDKDPILTQSPKGGPKTAEVSDPEIIPNSKLLMELNFTETLAKEQREKLEKVISKHKNAFSLEGRLGNYKAQVEINLCPGTNEISLPPYSTSPAKREIIDSQIDTWLNLGVIEPSKSPWGFPVIIVYWNSKPRLCVNYQHLNEDSIPDKYPLPKQTNILHALEGSKWLSTFDALSGFNQLTIKEEDRAKTTFRCHRGLFQFKRLPFGFRNRPAVFQ